MTNSYEVATIIELGDAQDVILAQKVVRMVIDSMTLEFGTYWDWYAPWE